MLGGHQSRNKQEKGREKGDKKGDMIKRSDKSHLRRWVARAVGGPCRKGKEKKS